MHSPLPGAPGPVTEPKPAAPGGPGLGAPPPNPSATEESGPKPPTPESPAEDDALHAARASGRKAKAAQFPAWSRPQSHVEPTIPGNVSIDPRGRTERAVLSPRPRKERTIFLGSPQRNAHFHSFFDSGRVAQGSAAALSGSRTPARFPAAQSRGRSPRGNRLVRDGAAVRLGARLGQNVSRQLRAARLPRRPLPHPRCPAQIPNHGRRATAAVSHQEGKAHPQRKARDQRARRHAFAQEGHPH